MTNHAEPLPVPPAAAAPAAAPARPHAEGTSVVRQALRDTWYLLAGLPVALVAFTVAVVGLSLAAGLLVTVVGIFVAVGTLYATTAFGHLERVRLAARGTELAPIVFQQASGRGLRRALVPLRDPRRWATLLHALGALPLASATWSVALTWWAGALGGLTYWFWERWLPDADSSTTLAELLELPVSESVLNLVLGLLLALTLPAVLRACAAVHAGWARLLLTGASRAALEAEVQDLTDRRSSAAAAEAHSLRRLERDLHDGPQQRLVRLAMDLSVAERRLTEDPDAARALLGSAREQAAETLAEIRALSRGIAPPVLADRGLAAAVSAVAARSTVHVTVDVALPDGSRPSPSTENAAYFVVTEALANVAKHARASRAEVRVRLASSDRAPGDDDGGATPDAAARRVVVEVHDDGVGGAALAKGHGLAGLADRVQGLGGTLAVTSPDGGPTVVTATLPWA
ncbi:MULTISPECIES: sensor histidine kinase [unclassified Actinotalea]|uniref:sensor histidine kinase n=1 Tax=unclassified Actinotalea TaxID=2638618 RepID=UPI0015F6269A|nr:MULTISPECIES: sensor histidine kinase [unclassified Actinotalea]